MPSPVVIADDQPVVAAGVRAALRDAHYDVVACVHDIESLRDALAERTCEIIVLDPFMPGGRLPDSVELIRDLRERCPDAGIVVMSQLDNLPALRLMLDEGVAALFDKRSHLRGIALAVRAASVGRTFISPSIRQALRELDRAIEARAAEQLALTPREQDVLHAYAQGLSLVEVARLMARSIKTISRQKRSAMVKLGLRNDAELYQYLASIGEGLVHGIVQRVYALPRDDDEAYVATRARARISAARARAVAKRGA
jgi:two-component system, NarL family, captular synthesis response regulator RcsB